jgi:hypothetical protein
MKIYAIFIDDSEIHVSLKVGTRESVETVRELIKAQLEENPDLEDGYVESYPFFQADWTAVGGRLPVGFDKNTILEI